MSKKCHKCYALHGNSDCICPPKPPSPAELKELDAEQLTALTQERDALREVVMELVHAGDGLRNGYSIMKSRAFTSARDKALSLLDPPAGAGNGKEVGT